MRKPHAFVEVKPKRITQELMNEVFEVGASVRDTGIIQCDSYAVHGAVLDMLEGKDREHETVEYQQRPLKARGLIADHIRDVTFGKRR